MTTTAAWTSLWWWWLIAVLVTFAVLESWSLYAAHRSGEKHIQDWTLSDTIRRWAISWRALSAITCGITVLLLVHFFATPNP